MNAEQISTRLRLPRELYEWLKALAASEKRSLHAQILYLLQQAMEGKR